MCMFVSAPSLFVILCVDGVLQYIYLKIIMYLLTPPEGTLTHSLSMCVRMSVHLQYCGIFPFSLSDPSQLALIRSHLGAFDSEVPASPLSNLSFVKAQANA